MSREVDMAQGRTQHWLIVRYGKLEVFAHGRWAVACLLVIMAICAAISLRMFGIIMYTSFLLSRRLHLIDAPCLNAVPAMQDNVSPRNGTELSSSRTTLL